MGLRAAVVATGSDLGQAQGLSSKEGAEAKISSLDVVGCDPWVASLSSQHSHTSSALLLLNRLSFPHEDMLTASKRSQEPGPAT